MFNTAWKGSLGVPEKVSSKSLVETAGYISAEKRITNLIMAGQRLRDYRAEQFDYPADINPDEAEFDPTREPNFDMADASQIEHALANKKQAEELEKALQTAPDASNEAQNNPEGVTPAE